MSDPSLTAAFNLERDGLHAYYFMTFFARNIVGLVDLQTPPETLILKKKGLASDMPLVTFHDSVA